MESIFGLAAALLGVIGAAAYIRDSYHRKTLPHRFAWIIFLILSIVGFASQAALGASASLIYAGWFVINNIIIVSLSLRKGGGYGGLSVTNIASLILAILGIVLWQTLSSPFAALMCVLIADAIGALLIIIKSYKQPQTETASMWALGIVAAALTMFSVGELNWPLLAPSIYLFIASTFVVVAIILGKRKNKIKTQ